MHKLIVLVAFLALAVACSDGNKTARSDGGTAFTLTGTVTGVSSGDKPSTNPKGVSAITGSITVRADSPVTGCDNPAKVFETSSTAGTARKGERIDITGTQYDNCVLVADSVSRSSETGTTTTGGGASATTVPAPSGSPKVKKGPAPEGAIYDQTPSVPPATQK